MGAIDSKKLNAALAKARNIGLVEEPCTIGGCDLVFRSLRSEDYSAALQDCDGLPEDQYISRYQKGHIARSIVEVDGVDLRDSQFVTVEEPDPTTGAMRTVKLELPEYLSKYMLDTWGKEAVDIAFRKLGDVLELAERQAKQGIQFSTQDETSEEKFRRLLLEARALEKELPPSLLEKILEEQGFALKSTREEIKRALERTDQLAREQEQARERETQAVAPEAAEAPKESVTPIPAAEQPAAEPPRVTRPRPVDPHVTLQNAIAARKALDVPLVRSEQVDSKPPASRSAVIAALEGDSEAVPDIGTAISLQSGDSSEVVEIRRAPVDAQAASTILDNPPIAGINPRFRPQQRG